MQKWASGSIEEWVFESYSIAKSRIYPGFPPGPVSVFGPRFPCHRIEIIEPEKFICVLKAGLNTGIINLEN
jgi:hypothetical protein